MDLFRGTSPARHGAWRARARRGALCALLGAGAAASAVPGVPAQVEPAADAPLAATIRDQVDVAVTVYNSNLGLVRDVRQVTLPSGHRDLRFLDIAATVKPATVHFRSLTEPGRLSVLEQNYQFDLLDPQRLLAKYVGRDVKLLRTYHENGSTRTEEVTARLLALNGMPVWRIGDEIVTGLHAEQYRFPEIPENLHSRPTLVWRLANRGALQHRIEAAYLAEGLNWNADYVLTIARDDRLADLDGWVTLSNTSGAAYRNARLQLVAGDLNRVQEHRLMRDAMMAAQVAERVEDSAAFAREAFSEYHLYSLSRRTTLLENESKQISLLQGTGIPVKKRFVVNGQQMYYRNAQHPGSPLKDSVRVFYELRNDEASGLGMPMPAGTVRVYQADSSGGVLFAGEDRIEHTPKDEKLSLEIGRAFDVVCERRQTDWERIADHVYEMGYEITLRNHKSAPITVEVNEPIGGNWQMLSSSHPSTRTNAWAAQFQVPVAADGETVLRYRVRVRW
jgi:hypothetical protein